MISESHKLKKLECDIYIFQYLHLGNYLKNFNNLVIGNIDLKLKKDQVFLFKVYMNECISSPKSC